MKNEKKTWTVYLIKHNGIVMYAGQTDNFKKRKQQHLHRESTSIPDEIDLTTITITPFYECDNKEEAVRMEDHIIVKYNLIENGWNHCRSGYIWKENPKEYHHKYNMEYFHREDVLENMLQYMSEYRKKDSYKTYQKEYQKRYQKEHAEEIRRYKKDWAKRKRNRLITQQQEQKKQTGTKHPLYAAI